jgi:hypothetical protein
LGWTAVVFGITSQTSPTASPVALLLAAAVIVAFFSGGMWVIDRFYQACKRAWRQGHYEAVARDRERDLRRR